MPNDASDVESALADLTRMSLAQLRVLDDSVLSRSLHRLLADADSPHEPVAGFQSSVLPDVLQTPLA